MLNTILQILISLSFFLAGTFLFKWHLILTVIGTFLVYVLAVLFLPNRVKIGSKSFDENELSLELNNLYKNGESQIKALKSSGASIRSELVKAQLDQIVRTGEDIMVYLKDNPEEISRSRKFLEIELPETVSVVNKYKKVENAYGPSEKMKEVQGDVIESLGLLKETFDSQKLSYYQNDLKEIEITSDALKNRKDSI